MHHVPLADARGSPKGRAHGGARAHQKGSRRAAARQSPPQRCPRTRFAAARGGGGGSGGRLGDQHLRGQRVPRAAARCRHLARQTARRRPPHLRDRVVCGQERCADGVGQPRVELEVVLRAARVWRVRGAAATWGPRMPHATLRSPRGNGAARAACPVSQQRSAAPRAQHAACPRAAHSMHCMQHAACSMQHAACSMQHAACSMQHAACSMQHAACSMQHAACLLHHAARSMQRAAAAHPLQQRAQPEADQDCGVRPLAEVRARAQAGAGRRRRIRRATIAQTPSPLTPPSPPAGVAAPPRARRHGMTFTSPAAAAAASGGAFKRAARLAAPRDRGREATGDLSPGGAVRGPGTKETLRGHWAKVGQAGLTGRVPFRAIQPPPPGGRSTLTQQGGAAGRARASCRAPALRGCRAPLVTVNPRRGQC